MKILQIHNEYKFFGGEDTVVKMERDLLSKNGHSVTQLIRSNKDEIKNIYDNFLILKNLHYSKKSIEILKEKIDINNPPDIVHIHNLFPLWTYSVFDFFKKNKIPVIMTLHNYRIIWDQYGILDKKLINYGLFKNSKIKTIIVSKLLGRKKELLNYVEKFITFTEFTKNEFFKTHVSKEKFVIKPNFLNNKDIETKKFNNKNNIIFASRVSDEKGIKTLLRAWQNLDIRLNIYGDGPLLNEVRKKHDTNKNLIFHGSQDREIVEKEISNSKILVFPSEWYECMPMTILEAFRAGTLVVASNIGSIGHIIKDKYNGILFEPGNYKDLEEKINWVLKNSDKSNTIANNALNDFNSLYNEETSYNQLVGIYKEVITNYKR